MVVAGGRNWSKKKEAKSDGVLFKSSSWAKIIKIEDRKSEDSIVRNRLLLLGPDPVHSVLLRRNGNNVSFCTPLSSRMAGPGLRFSNNNYL